MLLAQLDRCGTEMALGKHGSQARAGRNFEQHQIFRSAVALDSTMHCREADTPYRVELLRGLQAYSHGLNPTVYRGIA